jgi:hypothetical protein
VRSCGERRRGIGAAWEKAGLRRRELEHRLDDVTGLDHCQDAREALELDHRKDGAEHSSRLRTYSSAEEVTPLMRISSVVTGLIVLACACCVVLAALMLGPGQEDCPRPSSKSFEALFARCRTLDAAMGSAASPTKELSPPEEAMAEERQAIAEGHATVGVARSQRER